MLLEDRRKKRAVYMLVILAFSYLFLFHHLGSYSLKEPDEGRYAEIPREMVAQGNYMVPHLNYVRYFEKPPLLYWVTALSYKTLGVSEWSFRLPNALFALFCVLATYLFAARRFTEETAFTSSFILASSFGFFGMARVVTIDMLLSFLLFAALPGLLRILSRRTPPVPLSLFRVPCAIGARQGTCRDHPSRSDYRAFSRLREKALLS